MVMDWRRSERATRWHDVSQAVTNDLQSDGTARWARLTVDESISQRVSTVLIERKMLKGWTSLTCCVGSQLSSVKSMNYLCSLAQVWLLRSTKKWRKDWEDRNWITKSMVELDRVDVVLWKRVVVVGRGIIYIEEEGSECTQPQSSNFHTSSTHQPGNSNHRAPRKNLDIDKTLIDVIRGR